MFWLTAAMAGTGVTILDGPRNVRDFEVAVRTRKSGLSTCFSSAPGPAKFHVTVQPDGLVSDAKYSMSGSTDAAMLQCIYSEALRLRLVPNTDSGPTTFQWMVSLESLADGPAPEGPKEGEIRVEGALDEQVVAEVLSRNSVSYDFCKRKAKQMNAPIPPMLTTSFRIDPNGTVGNVDLGGAPEDTFTSCVSGRIRGFSFPKAETPGETRVTAGIGFSQ